MGQHYAEQALALNADSAEYYNNLSTEFDFTKNIKYYENLKNVIKHDPNHLQGLYDLGEYLSMVGRHKESLENFEKFLEIGGFFTNGIQRIGYAYWHNGDREKANYYFEMQVQYALAEIEQGRYWATHLLASYYDLATISAFRRENTKALEYLGKFSNGRTFPIWWISLIQNDPMLENVRLEPEFQQIVGKMEAKYQAEHERVRQWLVKNDMR